MRQLFHAVTIPKILYAVDVWLTPVHQKLHAHKSSGSVGTTNRFTSLQWTAALAITGVLHLTTTDILNLHSGLLPMAMDLQQVLGFTMGTLNTVVFWSWLSQLRLRCPISQHCAYHVPSPTNKGISWVLL